MSIVPLYGHEGVRARLLGAVARDALPASLLLTGPRGVGKQRLALWLGQTLLCEGAEPRPCGHCRACKFTGTLTHPDLHWLFPRPRLRDGDPSVADVRGDYAEAIAERVKNGGLYGAPPGTEGLYVAAIRALVQLAGISPAMARRKVFVIGDAERMVPQEGAEAAANAFLKLLEEPPADTLLVLTSSEPGALLPTIRSRVCTVRVAPLPDDDVRGFLADPVVAAALPDGGRPNDERVRAAAGAPGTLFGGGERGTAVRDARRLLEAATTGGRSDRARFAFARGVAGARGAFSDMLDELTLALREVARDASESAGGSPRDAGRALAASRAVSFVEQAKARAEGNVNPQLVTARLTREIADAFGRTSV